MMARFVPTRFFRIALCLVAAGTAAAQHGNPSPPPASGTFSVGPNDPSDTISAAAPSGGANYRVHNDGPGTIHVQPKNPSGGNDGPGVDVDPGDSTDVPIEEGDHLNVQNVNEPGPGDDDATGTYDKL